MGKEFSFDIVSEVNLQEVDNAVNQAMKEILTRFDFKGSKSQIAFNRTEKKVQLIADDEMKMRNLRDVLSTRLAKRSISMKALDYGTEEKAFDGMVRQEAKLVDGISQEHAKDIVRRIKDFKLKIQPSIQGESVRVTGKSKDDLQFIMQQLKASDLTIPLQFANFREH